jgi:integrase
MLAIRHREEPWAGVAATEMCNTEESWLYVFRALTKHFHDRSAASITPEEAQAWTTGLVKPPKRSARAVDNNYLTATKTVFGWAADHKRIPRNPFEKVKVTVPKARRLREKAFRPEEWRTILKATLAITETDTPGQPGDGFPGCVHTPAPAQAKSLSYAAQMSFKRMASGRWGSRQRRDRFEPRTVPLHEHLIEQGFLKFVDQNGPGPLFYNPQARRHGTQAAKKKKPRSVQPRQRLADWVRRLGVGGNGLSPLHGWRHTFKTRAARAGIEAGMRDAICGHSPRTVADEYETPSLEDMAAAMKKFPRYDV